MVEVEGKEGVGERKERKEVGLIFQSNSVRQTVGVGRTGGGFVDSQVGARVRDKRGMGATRAARSATCTRGGDDASMRHQRDGVHARVCR